MCMNGDSVLCKFFSQHSDLGNSSVLWNSAVVLKITGGGHFNISKSHDACEDNVFVSVHEPHPS